MESIKFIYKIGHGPSSSHTMGPENACLYIIQKYPEMSKVVVTLFGSLSLTGRGHLTDVIIKKTLKKYETEIIFDNSFQKYHPNTMSFKIFNKNNIIIGEETILSVGGGDIEIVGQKKQEKDEIYPFHSFDEIRKYCENKNLNLADFVYSFEDKSIKEYLSNIYTVMEQSIKNGLNKTGELPGGLHVLRKANQLYSSKNIKERGEVKEIRIVSSFAFSVSEENASGNLIVTAPTCGSCGVLPAVLFYYKKEKHISKRKIIDALAVAGIIGNVIKSNASISGAYAGCQSEIGTACSMTAAALAYINDMDLEEIEYAAEIALEHHLGLTCDPVNGLVQIPCIERNAVAALRAIDASNLSRFLNGTRKISFDTVVKTMYETGKDLKSKYKETSVGGLAKNYYMK